jgi:hypothetical protein
MAGLVARGSKYTDDVRHEAANVYAVYGKQSKVAEVLNIPKQTVQTWCQQEWFVGLVSEARAAKKEEHIARYTELTDKALTRALEAVDSLDGKAATIVAATATDKARLLSNTHDFSSGSTDMSALIHALSEAGKAASKAYAEQRAARLIDVTPDD